MISKTQGVHRFLFVTTLPLTRGASSSLRALVLFLKSLTIYQPGISCAKIYPQGSRKAFLMALIEWQYH